ncbi:unnamed protein product, partial [Ectocarpus fasciculatus]
QRGRARRETAGQQHFRRGGSFGGGVSGRACRRRPHRCLADFELGAGADPDVRKERPIQLGREGSDSPTGGMAVTGTDHLVLGGEEETQQQQDFWQQTKRVGINCERRAGGDGIGTRRGVRGQTEAQLQEEVLAQQHCPVRLRHRRWPAHPERDARGRVQER